MEMPVRQYIGARYVPLLGRKGETSILWDNTAPYEPLTVVLYQGNSYTSRQYVPAGIDIMNTDFWALTGNYNAQVEQYRQEVQGFAQDIEGNADAIAAVGDIIPTSAYSSASTVADAIAAVGDIIPTSAYSSANTVADAITGVSNAYQSADATLQDHIDNEALMRTNADATLQANIDAIETSLLDVAVRDYAVFIGDSYLRGTGSTDGASGGEGYNSIGNGWGRYLALRDEIAYGKIMCVAGGGAGFVSQGSNGWGNGLNFSGMLNKAAQEMDEDHIARTRYIVICGGVNDGADLSAAIVKSTIDTARSLFPGVPIHIFTNAGTSSPYNRLQQGNADAYGAMRQGCAGHGACYHEIWPLMINSANAGWMNDDHVHPTTNGYRAFGRAMSSMIRGGEIGAYCATGAGYTNITPASGCTFSYPLYFDGSKHCFIAGGTLTLDSTVQLTSGTPVQVGSIPGDLAPNRIISMPAVCNFTIAGSSSQLMGLCWIELTTEGVIRMRRPMGLSSNGATIVINQNVQQGATVTMPYMLWDLV